MELDAHNGRAIERRFRSSRLQTQASIDAFHFHHRKSRVQAKNRVLIGNPGVGKTFLARVIGSKARQANQGVLFTTAMDMLNHLLASQVDHSLERKLKTYTDPTLLIVDELGYLSLDQQTSNLFYQVVSTRHSEKRSTIITTNTPFSDWAEGLSGSPLLVPSMFNFTANHLLLLSRTEYPSCAVFLLRDLDTQRVYRLHDFTKALLIRPDVAYCVAGRVNSADKLYLVLESVRPDTRHSRSSNVPAPADGAEGSPIG